MAPKTAIALISRPASYETYEAALAHCPPEAIATILAVTARDPASKAAVKKLEEQANKGHVGARYILTCMARQMLATVQGDAVGGNIFENIMDAANKYLPSPFKEGAAILKDAGKGIGDAVNTIKDTIFKAKPSNVGKPPPSGGLPVTPATQAKAEKGLQVLHDTAKLEKAAASSKTVANDELDAASAEIDAWINTGTLADRKAYDRDARNLPLAQKLAWIRQRSRQLKADHVAGDGVGYAPPKVGTWLRPHGDSYYQRALRAGRS